MSRHPSARPAPRGGRRPSPAWGPAPASPVKNAMARGGRQTLHVPLQPQDAILAYRVATSCPSNLVHRQVGQAPLGRALPSLQGNPSEQLLNRPASTCSRSARRARPLRRAWLPRATAQCDRRARRIRLLDDDTLEARAPVNNLPGQAWLMGRQADVAARLRPTAYRNPTALTGASVPPATRSTETRRPSPWERTSATPAPRTTPLRANGTLSADAATQLRPLACDRLVKPGWRDGAEGVMWRTAAGRRSARGA